MNKCRVGNTGSAPRFVRRGSTLIDWVLPIFLWDRAALEFDELSYIKAEKASVTQVLLLAIESSSDSFSTDLHDLTM